MPKSNFLAKKRFRFFYVFVFVGVVIDNFDKLRQDERGRGQLSKDQMDWVLVRSLFSRLSLSVL